MKHFILAAAFTVAAQVASAQQAVTYTTDQSFDDVVFGIESAIVDAGLVVDSVSKVGEMLERTGKDVGSDVVIFKNAEVYSFCSAKVSRAVMEANPLNLMYCPYNIFIAVLPDKPDETIVGYREYPEGEMQQVQALLDGIIKAAIGE